jgi:hypothetical protein
VILIKPYKITCLTCGYIKITDEDFVNNINKIFKIKLIDNLDPIKDRLICSKCDKKNLNIQLQEEAEIKSDIDVDISSNDLRCSDDSESTENELEETSEINNPTKNNPQYKEETALRWDECVDPADKIIPFSSEQQRSGQTSIDRFGRGRKK